MAVGNYYSLTNLNVYKRITITLCDPQKGIIEGRDSSNQPIKLSYNFYYDPYVQVPSLGEDWVIKKIDNNWTLYGKYEKDPITPVQSLLPGDTRVESNHRLFINAKQEIIMDFNKAAPSLSHLGTSTIPGSAIYGSVSLDYINVGTAIIGSAFIGTANIGFGTATIGTASINSVFIGTANISIATIGTVITPWRTTLSSIPVDGQEEKVIFTDPSGRKIGWSFKYNQTSPVAYKWQFIGGAPYINFVTGSVSTTGTSWFNANTNTSGTSPFNYGGSPSLTIQYTGDYVLSGGGECIASANNMGFDFGLSINGTIPSSTLTTFAAPKDTPVSVNTTYRIDLNAGDVLTEVYRKNPTNNPGGSATFLNRWMQIIPLRVQA